jgi:hypothetical protein
MNNKSCFIIPTFPRDYNYLEAFNNLPDKIEFDIILILSFKSDLEILKKSNIKKVYSTIVLEDYLSTEYINRVLDKNIIITFKKYFGLNQLKEQYDYIATVDSEIEFVNTNNVYEKFELFCNNKKIIGSTITNSSTIIPETIKNISITSDNFLILKNYLK